jgi:hypothetical protein
MRREQREKPGVAPDKAGRSARTELPMGEDAAQFAAWTAVGRALLYLDETITRV